MGAADQICTTKSSVGQVSDSTGSDGSFAFSFDVSLELVKTSEVVTAGTLTSSNTQFGFGVEQIESLSYPNTLSYSGNVVVKAVTCTVSPKSLTVTLGDFPVSRFTGPGTGLPVGIQYRHALRSGCTAGNDDRQRQWL